jgi:hypothetical protein
MRRIASFLLLCPSSFLVCKGDPYPRIYAQRMLGAEDFLCLGLHAGAATGFLCPLSTYPFGVRNWKRDVKKKDCVTYHTRNTVQAR